MSAAVHAVLGLLVLAGCGSGGTPLAVPGSPMFTGHAAPVEVVVTGCAMGDGGTADRRCDPGALNPDVTQATIADTICRVGWTDTVRPPASYTTPLKRLDMARYGLSGPHMDFRYDHMVPLSLGGHPTDPANLWPQPVADSYRKDGDTRRLRVRVCAGELRLAAAQRELVAVWTHP